MTSPSRFSNLFGKKKNTSSTTTKQPSSKVAPIFAPNGEAAPVSPIKAPFYPQVPSPLFFNGQGITMQQEIYHSPSLQSVSLLEDTSISRQESVYPPDNCNMQSSKIKRKRKADFVNDTVKRVLTGIKRLAIHRRGSSPPPSQKRGEYFDPASTSCMTMPLLSSIPPLALSNAEDPQIHVGLLKQQEEEILSKELSQLDQDSRKVLIMEKSHLVNEAFEGALRRAEALIKIEIPENNVSMHTTIVSAGVSKHLAELHALLELENTESSLLNETRPPQIDSFVSPIPVLPLRRDSEVFQQHLQQIQQQQGIMQRIQSSLSQLPKVPDEAEDDCEFIINRVHLEHYKLSVENLKQAEEPPAVDSMEGLRMLFASTDSIGAACIPTDKIHAGDKSDALDHASMADDETIADTLPYPPEDDDTQSSLKVSQLIRLFEPNMP